MRLLIVGIIVLGAVTVINLAATASSGNQEAIIALVGLGVFGVFLTGLLALMDPGKPFKQDRALVSRIREELESPISNLDEESDGYSVVRELRIGELIRQFDQETTASISGWIDHQLGFEGWGLGVTTGRVGLATGSLGLSGTSRVQLALEGTSRANLVGDGWIAVLETKTLDSAVDVIRLVVPSEPAVRGFLQQIARSLAKSYQAPIPHSKLASKAQISKAADMVLARADEQASAPGITEISHVGDRLAALLRLPEEQRPSLTVVGLPIGGHAILGGALRFGNEERIYQLVPFPLLDQWLALPRTAAEASGEVYLSQAE